MQTLKRLFTFRPHFTNKKSLFLGTYVAKTGLGVNGNVTAGYCGRGRAPK